MRLIEKAYGDPFPAYIDGTTSHRRAEDDLRSPVAGERR